jgi:hypothetical protein
MKKLLLLAILSCSLTTVLADPWDNLTPAQATAVVKYLKENPFILDYCDCCDSGSVYLLKVLNTQIVPCEWDNSQKSVKVLALRIGELERIGSYPSAYRTKGMSETVEYTITMNYTFVYAECGKWAVPFFKVVSYSNNHICAGATRFPNPEQNDDIQNEEYIKWFKDKGID